MEKICSTDIYQKSIDVLTSQGKFYINLGLQRVQAVLEILGNPEKNLKFIHVAGTNGKGSVCAMLSSILSQTLKSDALVKSKKGKVKSDDTTFYLLPFTFYSNNPRVGLFTSPHVFEYTERIKINDVEISRENFAKNVLEIIELSGKNNIHLTEFEILTVVAFQYFAQNNVDLVILETGLGGRLDATNVIEKNICSIITHIDFDHTERLGDTIEKIATEKAGIIKQNCPVVTSKNNAGFEVIKKVAQEKNADIFLAEEPPCHCEEGTFTPEAIQEKYPSPEFLRLASSPRRGFAARGEGAASCLPANVSQSYSPIHLFTHSPLKGTYQRENLTLVLKVIELLNQNGFNITQEIIDEGLKNVKHPCRFEFLEQENIIIDGAHNPNGTKALRESLDYYFPTKKVRFIFGCLRNKQYSEMMANLFTSQDEIYFYEFSNPNACTYEELANVCNFPSKSFSEFKLDSNTFTVICGSFYMIKELLSKIDIK